MSAFPPLSEGLLAMIKNLTVVGFNDFSVGVADQHVRATHIGPVGSGVRCGQVTQLPLLNVVLIGTVHFWYGVPGLKCLKSAMKLLNSYLEIPEVLVEPAVAGAACAALVTSKSAPSNILFLMVINSPLWGSVISVAYLSCHTI